MLSGRGVDTDRKAAVALLYLAVSFYSCFPPYFTPSTRSKSALLTVTPDERHQPSQTLPDHVYTRWSTSMTTPRPPCESAVESA